MGLDLDLVTSEIEEVMGQPMNSNSILSEKFRFLSTTLFNHLKIIISN